jgi:hypothetical protein
MFTHLLVIVDDERRDRAFPYVGIILVVHQVTKEFFLLVDTNLGVLMMINKFFPNELSVLVKIMVSNDLHSSVGLEFCRKDRIHPLILGSEKRNVVRVCKVGGEGEVKDFNGVMSGSGSFHITTKIVPVLLISELRVLFLVFLDPTFKGFSWSRSSSCRSMDIVKNVGQGDVGSESEQAPAIEIISQYQHAIKDSGALVAEVVEHRNEGSDHEFVSTRNVQLVGK